MAAILLGCLAAGFIVGGGMCVWKKKHILSMFCGAVDAAATVLSAWGFREMLVESGKRLTPDLFGLGYYKSVLAVYALMFAIGIVYVLLGMRGLVKKTSAKCA